MKIEISVNVAIDLNGDGARGLATTLADLRALWNGASPPMVARERVPADIPQSVSQETPSYTNGVGASVLDALVRIVNATEVATSLDTAPKSSRAGRKLMPFGELDPRVRAEMARLSQDGCLPSSGRWDKGRDPALPKMNAILYRYQCKSVAELAERLGYKPTSSPIRRRDL